VKTKIEKDFKRKKKLQSTNSTKNKMKKDIWICFFPRRVGCGSWRLPAANLGDKSIT